MIKQIILGLFVLASAAIHAQEKVLAFPGADGFGKYTTGGRGGSVDATDRSFWIVARTARTAPAESFPLTIAA